MGFLSNDMGVERGADYATQPRDASEMAAKCFLCKSPGKVKEQQRSVRNLLLDGGSLASANISASRPKGAEPHPSDEIEILIKSQSIDFLLLACHFSHSSIAFLL